MVIGWKINYSSALAHLSQLVQQFLATFHRCVSHHTSKIWSHVALYSSTNLQHLGKYTI